MAVAFLFAGFASFGSGIGLTSGGLTGQVLQAVEFDNTRKARRAKRKAKKSCEQKLTSIPKKSAFDGLQTGDEILGKNNAEDASL